MGTGKLMLDNIKEQMESQGEVFMDYYHTYNLVNWLPKEIEFLSNHDIVDSLKNEREKRRGIYSVSNKLKTYSNKKDKEKISELERQLKEGGISLNQFKSSIENIGDGYLGNGKTKKIMSLVEEGISEGGSEKNSACNIIDEVPTGLPSGIDRFVKEFAKDAVDKMYK